MFGGFPHALHKPHNYAWFEFNKDLTFGGCCGPHCSSFWREKVYRVSFRLDIFLGFDTKSGIPVTTRQHCEVGRYLDAGVPFRNEQWKGNEVHSLRTLPSHVHYHNITFCAWRIMIFRVCASTIDSRMILCTFCQRHSTAGVKGPWAAKKKQQQKTNFDIATDLCD